MATDSSVSGAARPGARPRVVIVGAGFGGLACARRLDRAAADVLLLDRSGYHLFTPLLYQVATALLNPSEIAYPLRAVFRRSPNVRVSAATVTGVDLGRQVVRVSPGQEVPYDYLVLATGSANNYRGNEQLAEHSIGLKTLEDGTRLRNHVLGCLERADSETDPAERRALLTFVIAGGGTGGVEYAGALSELLRLVAGRDYPTVKPGDTRVLLVQTAGRLLTAFSRAAGPLRRAGPGPPRRRSHHEGAHHRGRRPPGEPVGRHRGPRPDAGLGRRRRPAGAGHPACAGDRPRRASHGG